MATLLRPPLVFDRRQKRPIGFAEIPPNLITSTLNADVLTLKQPALSVRLSDSAPAPSRKTVRVDITPNLLTSTLFVTTERIRQGLEQWDDSAPPRKLQVWVDPVPNLLTTTLVQTGTTIPLPLAAEQLDDSSPRRWKLNQVDHLYPLTLGINPNAAVMQWYDSAPPRKTQVFVEPIQRPFTLGINPNAAVATLDQSAVQRKIQVTVDGVPNLLGTTLGFVAPTLDLPQRAEQWDDSAPPRIRQTLAEQFMGRPVWLDAVPTVLQLDQSSFRAKFQVYLEPTPNLTATTLNLVLVPNVVGETQAQAETDLAAAGFTTQETFAYSDTIAAGLVISQVPTGGALVPPASIVSIVISLGVQPASGQRPAGRRSRRKYIIRVEGRVFEADDEREALAILAQAQVLAEKAASNRADEIVERALPKAISLGAVKPIAIKAPTISVSSGLKAQAEATQAAIDRAYASASAAAELRLLLALMEAEDDEDDFLLLH